MGSVAAQILWSGFLYGPDDGRLHSVVEWGCRFASLTGWGGRMGFRAGFSPLTGDPNQA